MLEFDHIICKRGEYHDVIYYSIFPWQSSAAVWKIDSDDTTDLLNVSAGELKLIATKGKELASLHLENYKDVERYSEMYEKMKNDYQTQNPSEALILLTGNI